MRVFNTITAGLLFGCGLAMSQGFSGGLLSKINPWATPDFAYLTRRLPPIVSNLPGKAVGFEATATNSVPREILDILVARTRAEVLKDRERGITFDDRNPDIQLRCQVTSWELTEQQRSETFGNNTRHLKRIIGNVSATVVVLNGKTRATLDSENLTHHYEEEFDMASGLSNHWWKNVDAGKKGARIPTTEEQKSLLTEGLAKKIAQRVVPIQEEVPIAIPKGKKFSEIKTLAESKRWGQVLEVAEKMEPFRDADDDSYRHYMVGVGHEAMAYTQAKDPKEIQDELSRAQAAYTKAKETNRGEKKFLDPDIRVQESIEHILKLLAISAGPGTGPGSKGESAAAPAPSEYNNQYLVHMFKVLRRSEKFIISEIETVAEPKFDDSPAGKTFLFDNGLTEDVVIAVSKRMAAERQKRPRASAPAPPTNTPVAAAPAPAQQTPAVAASTQQPPAAAAPAPSVPAKRQTAPAKQGVVPVKK